MQAMTWPKRRLKVLLGWRGEPRHNGSGNFCLCAHAQYYNGFPHSLSSRGTHNFDWKRNAPGLFAYTFRNICFLYST